MSRRDDELHVRPGRIKNKSVTGQVMRAAKMAGHVGKHFGQRPGAGSTFGRGRSAALGLAASTARRVTVKARVVQHQGKRFRAAPLARHLAYLKREGVTRDGQEAQTFNAESDGADDHAFADRCKDDRHHFRFMVSPEDASEMADLKAFTRELMADASRDLGTKLEWVAVDHWNTDNPHIHVLVRGRTDKDQDLVISRAYISRGLRERASARVGLELGPRSEQEIRAALEKEMASDRWTSLDNHLQRLADDGAGIADLRPGGDGDPEVRRLMLGRAAKLARLGLADQIAPGCWSIKPGLQGTLRVLSERGDIIKTLHRAMSRGGGEPDPAGFAIHPGMPRDPVLGRLVDRGLLDEIRGTGYAVIAGTDGRTHHVSLGDLALTGDAATGAIVETRTYQDGKGRASFALAVRSDLTLAEQIKARGPTWLDRQLVGKPVQLAEAGFGAEVKDAMVARGAHLVTEGFARRDGQRLVFAPNLLATLGRRELGEAAGEIARTSGRVHRPAEEGDPVAGTYRQRVSLAAGRFAMIDDGLGFQLVPWRPALESHLGREVGGRMTAQGVAWSFERDRGLGL
jgi:type IV secretory pathway VirD2 relaxase